MEKMKKCSVCGADIASSAKACPKCGAKNKKPFYRRPGCIILLLLAVVIGGMFAIRSYNGSNNQKEYIEKGYAILKFDDGSEMRSWELNELYDTSAVEANTYIGKEVETTMHITSIDDPFIEDYTGCLRFSFNDYTLTQSEYNTLTSLREDDVIKVRGTIDTIGGGDWFIELDHITSIKKIDN